MPWNFIDDYSGDRFVTVGDQVFDLDQLKIDEYYLTVSSDNSSINPQNVYLHVLNKECVGCPYLFVNQSAEGASRQTTNHMFRLATEPLDYYPQDQMGSVICDLDPNFDQFGVYKIVVNNLKECTIDVVKEPVNTLSPILSVFLIQIFVFGALFLLLKLWSKWQVKKTNEQQPTVAKPRILSLDTFRGLSIAVMIFANYGCGGYRFVEHAVWNGLHVADLVFPWFMWIMGACIPISLTSSFKRGIPQGDLLLGVFKRSLKLFLIGVFLQSGCDLYYLRAFGVLQRFGVTYFVVTTICIFTMNRDLSPKLNHPLWKHLEDILKVWKAWLVCGSLMALHTVLIFTVSAPGCPKGYMGPGGLHENRTYENCIGGATGYIDGLILGNHRYQHPTIYKVFEAKPFDPEGVTGCLATVFHVMLGVQAGVTLLVFKGHYQRLRRWLAWSLVLGALAGGLCNFSQEGGVIPLNKNLWSLSFVCATCSLAFLVLSLCYFLIDVKKWWSGKPLLFAGMNAIILYIGHNMTQSNFPVRWYYSGGEASDWRRTHFIAFLSDLWAVDFWIIVSYYLYKIKYFFSV